MREGLIFIIIFIMSLKLALTTIKVFYFQLNNKACGTYVGIYSFTHDDNSNNITIGIEFGNMGTVCFISHII